MKLQTFLATALTLIVVLGCTGDVESSKDKSARTQAYPADPAPIVIDGDTADWSSVSVRHTDIESAVPIDLQRLRVAHTPDHLYLQVQLDSALTLQEENSLELYLDTDGNVSTGHPKQDLGAEVIWKFGARKGTVVTGGDTTEIGHNALGFSSLPTVRSRKFEVALDRTVQVDGKPLFPDDSLRLALKIDGDRLPNTGGVNYRLSQTRVEQSTPTIRSQETGSLRLLSYNARRDALFKPNFQPAFGRVLNAVNADVIGFQEIYQHSAEATGKVVDSLMTMRDSSKANADWAFEKTGQDLVVASRYPVLGTYTIPGYEDYESGAFLLDTRKVLGQRLVLVVMHPPCCNFGPEDGEPSRNVQRQYVVDGVAAFLRKLKEGDGPFEVQENTPVVVMGDMNFVGDPQQPRTLKTGGIVHRGTFGSPAAPDWDGSALQDVNPMQTGHPMHTTWIDAGSSFPPGRLDYVYISDSVLQAKRSFLLHTSTLSDSALTAHGLQASDTRTASDHLPVVVDVATR